MRSMIWFRRDLRVYDNPALFHACRHGRDGVLAVYVIDETLWKKNDTSEVQIAFISRGLQVLKADLDKLGIALRVEKVEKTDRIPSLLEKLAQQHKITKVFWNREDEANESQRDRKVQDLLKRHNLSFEIFCDQLILDAPQVRTSTDGYFKVFTPFRKRWIQVFRESDIKVLPVPKPVPPMAIDTGVSSLALLERHSPIDPDLWPAGEKTALKRARQFFSKKIFSYDRNRDIPSIDGTSQLSPWLATGMISAKVCFLEALTANHGEPDSGNRGATVFLSELVWREFYRHILIHAPYVSRGKPFQLETDRFPWRQEADSLIAWQSGMTGYPLVDAGMRQLNQTGWMHNRLRMVTAMFLTKNLLHDWRLGEKYFASHLVDFDFASNNGGWQWSASTGTDAVPWFRLFNPVVQSQRFDPEGKFIRKFCPELASFDNKLIHEPWKQPERAAKTGYPAPVVDLAVSRQRVLAAWKRLRS